MIQRAAPNRGQFLTLGLILAAAAFVRFYQIGAPSLWMDEIWSIEMSMGRGSVHDHLPAGVVQDPQCNPTSLTNAAPWWKIWTSLNGYPHPPLYPILLRWWMDAFGSGGTATRALSTLFDLLAIAVFFDICRLLHGNRVGLLACAIMALAPAEIDFAQEVRSYTLLILLALCSGDLLIRIEKFGPASRRIILLAIAVSATALTHYLAVPALIALAVYAIVRLRSRSRRDTLLAFICAAAFTAIVWGPFVGRQISTLPSTHPGYLWESNSQHARLTLLRLIGMPGRLIYGDAIARRLPAWTLVATSVLLLAIPVIKLFRNNLLLWILWLAGTLGCAAAIDLARGSTLLQYLRYTILAAPAVYAVFAAVDWPPRPLLRDAVPCGLLAVLIVLVCLRLNDGVPTKEDWRQLADDLNAHVAPDELLVFYGNDPWISPGTWYMGFKYYVPQSRRPWLILSRPADAALLRQLRSRRCLWMTGLYPEIDGPRLLPGWRPELLMDTTAGHICRMIPTDASQRALEARP